MNNDSLISLKHLVEEIQQCGVNEHVINSHFWVNYYEKYRGTKYDKFNRDQESENVQIINS